MACAFNFSLGFFFVFVVSLCIWFGSLFLLPGPLPQISFDMLPTMIHYTSSFVETFIFACFIERGPFGYIFFSNSFSLNPAQCPMPHRLTTFTTLFMFHVVRWSRRRRREKKPGRDTREKKIYPYDRKTQIGKLLCGCDLLLLFFFCVLLLPLLLVSKLLDEPCMVCPYIMPLHPMAIFNCV